MFTLHSNADPFCTGRFIYSDVKFYLDDVSELPLLNRLGYVPGLSLLTGALRCIVAVAHIFAHAFKAIFSRDKEHLPHVVKGFAEFTRGLVEMVPIIGNAICAVLDHYRAENEEGTSLYHRVWLIDIQSDDIDF